MSCPAVWPGIWVGHTAKAFASLALTSKAAPMLPGHQVSTPLLIAGAARRLRGCHIVQDDSSRTQAAICFTERVLALCFPFRLGQQLSTHRCR